MKMRLITKQIQKQVLAPAMQQSIEMLMLPYTELNIAIEQELQSNPLLEIDESKNNEESFAEQDQMKSKIEHILQDYPTSNLDYGQIIPAEEINTLPIGNIVSLEDVLNQQLRIEFEDPEKLRIGEFVIGNLDEDGYLTVNCEEIVQALDINNSNLIEEVLATIRSFEPLGIGSRNLRECLLSQMAFYSAENKDLICKIIADHLNELGQKKFQIIAKTLEVSLDDIKEAAHFIASLDPKPARNYRPVQENIYIKPDIIITQDNEDDYQIRLNNDQMPQLRINLMYKKLLKKENIKEKEKDFIYERFKNALLFIKSIEQRGSTILAIGEYILDKQKNFLKIGPSNLTPMTLKDVAKHLNRNESTISRAIQNKFVLTPLGLLPIKYFFTQAIQGNNEIFSNQSLKEEIRDLIDDEDKAHPLSDQGIVDYFAQKGINIARRTINKYRKALKILPSYLRKN